MQYYGEQPDRTRATAGSNEDNKKDMQAKPVVCGNSVCAITSFCAGIPFYLYSGQLADLICLAESARYCCGHADHVAVNSSIQWCGGHRKYIGEPDYGDNVRGHLSCVLLFYHSSMAQPPLPVLGIRVYLLDYIAYRIRDLPEKREMEGESDMSRQFTVGSLQSAVYSRQLAISGDFFIFLD